MKDYIALDADNKIGFILTSTKQMDKFLSDGYTIVSRDYDGSNEVVIATPEDGYLVEKPTLPYSANDLI